MNTTAAKRAFLVCSLLLTAPTLLVADSLDGRSAPDFVLKSLGGDNLRLSEYRGEVVMLNFWASWCGPCRQGMSVLDEMYERYHKVGFELLGVNIDRDPTRAAEMVRALGVTFPVLYDERKQVTRLYQVEDMPVTMLIDRNGVVRYVNYGFQPSSEEKYVNQIRTLLRE